MTPTWQIIVGDARQRLADLPAGSVHTVVTSPPYFGLRDYGTADWTGGDPACVHQGVGGRGRDPKASSTLARAVDLPHVGGAPHRGGDPWRCRCGARRVDRQIGLEPTPDEFTAALVDVFREVRRVLRDDGTVWLNLGDSYADKDLLGIPWMVAFALRDDGWCLRSDIVWHKPNPMPESVRDRPTRSHEYVFLLAKSPSYFYDADAIREQDSGEPAGNGFAGRQDHRISGGLAAGGTVERVTERTRTLDGEPVADAGAWARPVAHSRVQPTARTSVAQPSCECGTADWTPGVVLDPFAGAGTTLMVALRRQRSAIGIELNPELARQRIVDDAPLLNATSELPAEVAA